MFQVEIKLKCTVVLCFEGNQAEDSSDLADKTFNFKLGCDLAIEENEDIYKSHGRF